MNIYVGNMSYNTGEQDLRRAFEEFGAVDSVKVIMDRDTGRPRGFAFVEMPDDDQARQAIEGLNGTDMQGRNLTVNEARPRDERPAARQRW